MAKLTTTFVPFWRNSNGWAIDRSSGMTGRAVACPRGLEKRFILAPDTEFQFVLGPSLESVRRASRAFRCFVPKDGVFTGRAYAAYGEIASALFQSGFRRSDRVYWTVIQSRDSGRTWVAAPVRRK